MEVVVTDVLKDHRAACDGFREAVRSSAGRWHAPSPCTEWDARAIIEHVIGFHVVLLLRPPDAKPKRPREDPEARWEATVDALFPALSHPGVLDAQRQHLSPLQLRKCPSPLIAKVPRSGGVLSASTP
jgi:hypothetical protein